MPSRCTDHQQKDWSLVNKKVSPKSCHQNIHRQDNDRTKLHTGAGVVLPRNTFSPWFFPRCVRVLGRDPASGYQVPGRALRTGLTTHTLYIELTPGPRTPQSDTTHSQDKVASAHSPLITHVPHSTSGDLKWSRDLIFSNLFWSAKTFVIHLMSRQIVLSSPFRLSMAQLNSTWMKTK